MFECKIDNMEGDPVKLWVTGNPDEARHHQFRWSEMMQVYVKPMKEGELPTDCDGDWPVLIEGGVYKLAVTPDLQPKQSKGARIDGSLYLVANLGITEGWMLSKGDEWIKEVNGSWSVDPSGIVWDEDGCKSGFVWRDLKYVGATLISVATPSRLPIEKLAAFEAGVAELAKKLACSED